MYTDNDADFDYNSNDDYNWDDDDEDLDNILELSHQNSINKEDYKCWKCMKCENINNVKLTIEKENMKCCGCNNENYIPDETKTFQSSKWHNHNDYLLRIGILKQIQVWICNQCTFQNKTNDSKQCEMCQSNRNSLTITKTISISNDDYNTTNILISNTNINNIITNSSDPKWQCTNCNGMSASKSECNICGCHKASKFNNTFLSEILTFGYIRELNICMHIPIVIYKLCQQFYANYGGFGMRIIYRMIYKTDSEAAQIDKKTYKTPLKRFLFKGGWKYNLFGKQLISIFNNKTIYVWKIKLKINESLCVMCDEFENDNNNYNQKRDNIKLWGVSIGIVSQGIWKCTQLPRDFLDNNLGDNNDNMFTLKKTYGIYGNGIGGDKHKQFCRGFMQNDMITLKFDTDKKTLSYGINNDWYGIAYRNIENDVYKLGVFVEQKGVIIECLEFVQY